MQAGRRDVHRPRLYALLVLRQLHRQLRAAREHFGEEGPVARIEVLDHEHGHGKVGSQAAQEGYQALDATG
ncbi:hypothetical protein GCM10009837_17950 [Streptomyces durmitorensis]